MKLLSHRRLTEKTRLFTHKTIVTKSKVCFTKLNLTLTWLRALLTGRFYSGLQRTISVKIFIERKSTSFAFLKGERRFFQDACVWKLNSPKDPHFLYLHDGFNKNIRFCQGGKKRVHHGGKFFAKRMSRIHRAFSADEINWEVLWNNCFIRVDSETIIYYYNKECLKKVRASRK